MSEESKDFFKEMTIFEVGNNMDVSAYSREKNGLTYMSWMREWVEAKKLHPKLNYRVAKCTKTVTNTRVNDNTGNNYTESYHLDRPWFDDGSTGWVEVTVYGIEGQDAQYNHEYHMMLPIMDFKNKPIPADKITSTDANKAIMRCLTKALAMATGIGAYVYASEDMPDDMKALTELREKCQGLASAKYKKADLKDKVTEVTNTVLAEWGGSIGNCDDADSLNKCYKELLKLR